MRDVFRQTLLTASGRDGNGGIFLYAWALVESENKDSWSWFLENMTEAEPGWIPGLEASIYQWTVISDRDKGKFPLSCTRPLADIIYRTTCRRLSTSSHPPSLLCMARETKRATQAEGPWNHKVFHEACVRTNDSRG